MAQGKRYPCGAAYEEPEANQLKCEIACQLVGCKNCKNYNGTDYYTRDIKRGVSMWAKHELENMQYP